MSIVLNKGLAIPPDAHLNNYKADGTTDYVADITPSDSTPLVCGTCRRIWCDVAGTISVIYNGVTTTYTLTAGDWHAIPANYIKATGTTATGIKVAR